MTAAQKDALKAHKESLADEAQIASELKEALGLKLTAHALNVRTQTFGDWASGKTKPKGTNAASLRNLALIYKVLAQRDDVHTIRAWFIGFNPMLDDTAPADVANEGRYRDVLIAAKAFSDLS